MNRDFYFALANSVYSRVTAFSQYTSLELFTFPMCLIFIDDNSRSQCPLVD